MAGGGATAPLNPPLVIYREKQYQLIGILAKPLIGAPLVSELVKV